MIAGFCAAPAVALDPPAILIAAPLIVVILAMRIRAAGFASAACCSS